MLWYLFGTAGLLAAAVLLAARWAFAQAFAPPRGLDPTALPEGEQYERERPQMEALIKEMAAIPYEEIIISARDGTPLFGRYYHVSDNAPLQIQMHGYHGSALRDFCGGNKIAREAGHNTLVVDQRAQGRSGGRAVAFGILERYDCLAWIEYAKRRFGNRPVILTGVSMGAATVLMAAGLPLPDTVKAVIADSPYSSPEAIIRLVCAERGIPPALAMPFVRLAARLWGGFRLRAASPVDAVRHAAIPILLIHGEEDRFVPCAMSAEIADAAPALCRRETFPQAGHGISFLADRARYVAVIDDFLAACGIHETFHAKQADEFCEKM